MNKSKKLKNNIFQLHFYWSKNEIQILREIIAKKEEEKLNIQAEWQQFELQKMPLLINHEAAEPFKERILNLENKNKNQIKLKNRFENGQKDLFENEKKLVEILKSASKLIKSETDFEYAIQNIQKFRGEVNEICNQQRNQESILTQQQFQIEEIVASLKNIDLSGIKLNALSETSLIVITEIAEERQKNQVEWLKFIEVEDTELLNFQKDKFEINRKHYIELSGRIKDFTESQKGLNESENEGKLQFKFIEENIAILGKIQEELIKIESEIEKLEIEKDKLSKAFNFDKQRNVLLKKDEPCPLCGATEHPFLSHYANNYVEVDQQIIAQKALQKEQSKQLIDLSSKIETARQVAKKEQERKFIYEEKNKKSLSEIAIIKKELALEKVGNLAWVEEKIVLIDSQINTIGFLEKS